MSKQKHDGRRFTNFHFVPIGEWATRDKYSRRLFGQKVNHFTSNIIATIINRTNQPTDRQSDRVACIRLRSHDGPTSTKTNNIPTSVQVHGHVDGDCSKVGASLWGSHGKFEGAVMGNQVLESGALTGEVGVRINIANDLFVGAKIDSKQNVRIFSTNGPIS